MTNRTLPVLLALAGLSWTSAQALLPDMGFEWPVRLAAVADAPGRQAASAALLILAGCLLVLSAVGIARVTRSGPGARLIRIGTGLLALGGIWLVAGRGVFSMTMLRATAAEVDRDAAVAMMTGEGGLEFLALLPTLPALLVGPVLLAIGARRAGAAGLVPLVCWVAGIGTFVATEFTNKVGESLGVGVASVGLVLVGVALSRPAAESVSRRAVRARRAGRARAAAWSG